MKIQKPFSINAWKHGAKIETRDGRSVRILCTNLKCDQPIIVAIMCNDGKEAEAKFSTDGSFCPGFKDDCDLVIVEEVEEPWKWAGDKEAKGEGWTLDDDNCEANVTYRPELELNEKYNYDVFATEKHAKSALAMARISQLMTHDNRYGGIVTEEEWEDGGCTKFCIARRANRLWKFTEIGMYCFLAFHSEEQCDLFLSENEQLVKDYLMIS